MQDLELTIGNKNYSSWSLRAWLFMRHAQVDFVERRLALNTQEFGREIAKYSPSRRVPSLRHGALVVWDSLAICEYVAEAFAPQWGWPEQRDARAVARAVSAEMHSSFAALRATMPMNCRRRVVGFVPNEAASHDIARVCAIWADCLARFSDERGWLFGDFCIADAMFAPVAIRFYGYCTELAPQQAAYVDRVLSHPHVVEWIAAGTAEDEIIDSVEV